MRECWLAFPMFDQQDCKLSAKLPGILSMTSPIDQVTFAWPHITKLLNDYNSDGVRLVNTINNSRCINIVTLEISQLSYQTSKKC